MRFNISVFNHSGQVTQPIGGGILRNQGNDFEEAATGVLTINGYSVEAILKLAEIEVPFENPAQAKLQFGLYDEKL